MFVFPLFVSLPFMVIISVLFSGVKDGELVFMGKCHNWSATVQWHHASSSPPSFLLHGCLRSQLIIFSETVEQPCKLLYQLFIWPTLSLSWGLRMSFVCPCFPGSLTAAFYFPVRFTVCAWQCSQIQTAATFVTAFFSLFFFYLFRSIIRDRWSRQITDPPKKLLQKHQSLPSQLCKLGLQNAEVWWDEGVPGEASGRDFSLTTFNPSCSHSVTFLQRTEDITLHRPHGGLYHLWTVAGQLSVELRATVGFQLGHRGRPAEKRRAGQPVRLLPGHAPAAQPGGQSNVRAY